LRHARTIANKMAHLPPCVDLNAGAGIGNRNPAGHPAGRLPLGLNVHGQPLPCYHVLAPFMHIEFFNSRRMWALLKGLIVQSFAGLAFAHLHAYTAALDSVDLVEQADVSLFSSFFQPDPRWGGITYECGVLLIVIWLLVTFG
jgi:hypothetical protein